MRRRDDSPVGTMELLILRSLESFRDRGLKEASLNGIPLASVERPGDDAAADDSRLRDALRWLYDHGGAVYEAKNLFRFKSKFAPRWEPMYLVYPESANSITNAGARCVIASILSEALSRYDRRDRRTGPPLWPGG